MRKDAAPRPRRAGNAGCSALSARPAPAVGFGAGVRVAAPSLPQLALFADAGREEVQLRVVATPDEWVAPARVVRRRSVAGNEG